MVGEVFLQRCRQEGNSRLDPEQVHKRLSSSCRSYRESGSTIRAYCDSQSRRLHSAYRFLAPCWSVVVDASYREVRHTALSAHSQPLENVVADREVLDLLEATLRTFHYGHDFERGRVS